MPTSIPPIPYSLYDIRRLCRQVTQAVPEIALDRHRIVIHDIHPDYVAAGHPVHEHVHSFYEGHIFLDGGGLYIIDREEFVGCSGTLLHEPHAPHAWAPCDVPCLRLLIWFSMEPMINVPRPAVWPLCPDLCWEVLLLLDEVNQRLPGWHHRTRARVTVLISRMLGLAGWPESPQPAPTPETDLIAMVDQFFRDNLARPLILPDVAAHVGMSERSLCRQFSELTGTTVMEHLLNLRMDRAAKLLIETDSTLTDIAQTLGFTDTSYFCRRFRRHFDMTAAQYRKGIRAKS